MTQRLKFSSGVVSMTTGSEGPRHDPYSYREICVERNGKVSVIHMGLALWVQSGGEKEHFWEDDGGFKIAAQRFRDLTGYDPDQWEGFIYRAEHSKVRSMSRADRIQYESMQDYDARLLRYAM